ncbi:MAG TPA: YhdP family protein [Eoetvoesiella sp.]
MFRTFSPFRLLGLIALAAYFCIAAVLLGVRYWVLPNIDQWRPHIARELSAALDTNVDLTKVSASWKGLNPSLELSGVVLTDNRQRAVLRLPHVHAVLDWRSFFYGSPKFLTLEATGLDLRIRRDENRQLWVLGRSFELEQNSQQEEFKAGHPAFQWLLQQREIILNDSIIRWNDELRGATPLVLRHVDLKIYSNLDEHRLSLSATPPPDLGKAFDMRGQFKMNPGKPATTGRQPWDAQVYVRIDGMKPLNWRPWLDIPDNLDSGEVSAQSWLEVRQGQFERFTSDVIVHNAHWTLGPESDFQADIARLYLSGSWDEFKEVFSGSPAAASATRTDSSAIDIRFQAQALALRSIRLFHYPIAFDQVGMYGQLSRQDNHAIKSVWDQVRVVNSDVEADLQGSWEQGGSGAAGIADISGIFKRASIAAINEYMPDSVNLDAREWMAKGLVAGQIQDARLLLKGDLEHFPFGENPFQGDFRVEGSYSGGVIDYLPPEKGEMGWPRLTDMTGRVALYRSDLRVLAEQATLWPTPATPIQLHQVKAQIPNIEHDSVLTVQGNTAAQGEAYMALMTHSPLGKMLDGVLDGARGSGPWQVPLRLTVPLLNSHDSTVRGAIHFEGGTVSLSPEIPLFSQLTGTLSFSDVGIAATDLKAKFMGGAVVLNGDLGGMGKGLQLRGQTSAKAVSELVDLEGMKRLDGSVSYQALLQRTKADNYVLSLKSDLLGMALDFPAPLGKTAAQRMPLHFEWSENQKTSSSRLDATLGPTVKARFLHRKNDRSASYFDSAALGVSQNPDLLPVGLNIDVRHPNVDIDAWKQVVDEFSKPLAPATLKRERPLLPDVRQFRLQSEKAVFQGLTFDQLTFTARQPEPLRWRVDISSSQTAGTMFWREASGKVAGQVDAKFDRLALGEDPTDGVNQTDVNAADELYEDFSRLNDYLDIPAINLEINNLKLYGRDIGRLSVQGVNQSRGELWKLNKLNLSSPGAQLAGSGLWRLTGAQRGLALDAQMQITDLGQYLDQIGMKNVLTGGRGTINGKLEWRNLPWRYNKSDLNGQLDVELSSGRFMTLNSRSARLLELLSLQSIQRLASFKFNPANLAKDGFPFDDLRGKIDLERGILNTANYRVTGPVATIVIGGDINLSTEKIDLQAVVIPNLDVSGAAIAAGIAVNPIIGIGAFLTQWLLKSPLAKAMTVQYQVAGDWDEPTVTEIAQVRDAKKEGPD